ncbi:MAG: cytochrome c oxidase assembly protein [Lysobacteraceae bacterium]
MTGGASSTGKRRFGVAAMVAVSVAAFGFSFALVPLYRIACEKLLGVRLERGAVDTHDAKATGRSDRLVTVMFDGTVNSKLPWEFGPSRMSMQVRPGEVYETTYFARNKSGRDIVGSATPSIAPARGSKYFNKTECFCFTAQTLAAGETREMPVRFIVDPDLPEDVRTLTLSYTFFKNDLLTARLNAPKSGASADAQRSAP